MNTRGGGGGAFFDQERDVGKVGWRQKALRITRHVHATIFD